MSTIAKIGGGLVVGLLVLAGCGALLAPASSTPAGTPRITTPLTPVTGDTAETAALADGTLPGDGTYTVGLDIQPGTYRTTGPADGHGWCYWARLKNLDGDLNSIIANDGSDAGTQVVTVKKTDRAFKTSGCNTWTRS